MSEAIWQPLMKLDFWDPTFLSENYKDVQDYTSNAIVKILSVLFMLYWSLFLK